MEEAVLKMISNYGFPIVMCLLLYFRAEKYIKLNTDALLQIKLLIKEVKDKINR